MAAITDLAKTIFEQIHGNRLRLMIGAKDFLQIENGLQFSFPQAKNGINRCIIKYNYGLDLYTVEFGRVAKKQGTPQYTMKKVYDEVYFDMFDNLIEEETGLYVHF
jgi:hypothetical protein